MNRFYHLPKFLQWGITLILLVVGLSVMGTGISYGTDNLLFYIPVLMLLMPVLQFTMTPFFRLIGLYRYLSSMLLVYAPNDRVWGLHNGTSFDYLFVLRGVKAGAPLRRQILKYYLEGLLHIADLVEQGELSREVLIKGSSYFFTERTAERLGFEIVSIPAHEKLNLYFNYLDLLWMYSLAHAKLRFPNLKGAKSAQVLAGNLLKNRASLERLHNYLKNG
ncbi:MAG: hypothetical protein KI786_11650 [Mameliella sp.]|nr:hypothetical protein [Phaeodactylibacter sp.]